ncbi:MAG: tetratricopeptide repeat protein [Gemmataceae bacterium]
MALKFLRLSRRGRERLQLWRRRFVNAVVYPWDLIVGSFSWMGRTIARAWGSRHLRYMLQGLPALFATVGVLVLTVAVWGQDPSLLAILYRIDASKALSNQDFDVARTMAEKAIALDNPKSEDANPDDQFLLIKALEGKKTPESLEHAYAIVKNLAPDDRTGYPQAHIWLAEYVFKSFGPNDVTLRFVENHYRRAYAGAKDRSPDSPWVKVAAQGLGITLLTEGRALEAEPYLRECADRFPVQKLNLGLIYRATNRPDDAKRMYEDVAEYYRKKAITTLDDHDSRFVWVQALRSLEKFDEALEVLNQGMTLKPSDDRYRKTIADVYFEKEAKLARRPDSSLAERFGLIQSGLTLVPNHPHLLNRLFDISMQKGEEAEKSQKLIRDLLNNGAVAPILHFLLGTQAFNDGKLEEAKLHWETAYKSENTVVAIGNMYVSTWAIVGNNLAWLIAQKKDVDTATLQNALEMVNGAIRKTGEIPAFAGTRGEILVKLGRYQEAIPNLTKALQGSPENVALHDGLVKAYEATGDKSSADRHRAKAEELRRKNVRPTLPEAKPASNANPLAPATPAPQSGEPAPSPKEKAGASRS